VEDRPPTQLHKLRSRPVALIRIEGTHLSKIAGSSTDLSRKRDAGRSHHANSNTPELVRGVALPVSWPEPDKDWAPIAAQLYVSVKNSGQAAWYQSSDVMMLYLACSIISDCFNHPTKRGRAQDLQTADGILSRLLVTVGDRRRLRVELELPKAEEVQQYEIDADDLRRELTGGN
jgi:hypothetical protein